MPADQRVDHEQLKEVVVQCAQALSEIMPPESAWKAGRLSARGHEW